MKLLLLSVLCAVVGSGTCSVVAWSDASPLSGAVISNFLPPQRTFGYHDAQYVNTISPAYSFGYQPQYSYQPFNYLSSLQSYPTYQPIGAPAYYPSSSFFYPQLSPVTPVGPFNPLQPGVPQAPPQQPGQQGDEDSEIIESAEYSAKPELETVQQPSAQPESSSTPPGDYLPPSLDTKNMPEFPQVPQNMREYQPKEPSASSPNQPLNQDQIQNGENSVSVESA